MAMSNAERQRKFRAFRRENGLVKKEVWTDRAGLLAPPSESGAWRQMSIKELDKGLKKLFPDFEDWEREVVHAELFEYAKTIEKRLKTVMEQGKKEIQEANQEFEGSV